MLVVLFIITHIAAFVAGVLLKDKVVDALKRNVNKLENETK